MAQDIFLKLTGIDGESLDSTHKNEIELLSWRWCVTQESNMHSGFGGGAGKATVGDLSFQHAIDRATPNLLKYCLTGKHISEAVLTVRKAGGTPLEYLKITMTDVIVTKVEPMGNSSSERIYEEVALAFSKVSQEYVIQNQQGGSGGTITATFDIKANKEA
ncbi:MAG: type VI secretion system tube protein Hcp [Betaproteobacteria bacterium]|nr:type VI secretion system tube protein Hcp [Betaproteobacteria bacterium]